MPKEPFGWCVFCDDVRNEVGGKVSFMGVYSNDIVFSAPFPVTVPQFSIIANYRVDIHDPITDEIMLEISFPGDTAPIVNSAIPVAEIQSGSKKPEYAQYFSISARLIFSPCEFKADGLIEVWIARGESRNRIGVLAVRSSAAQTSG